MSEQIPIEEILDLARWAPSGDNTQPWRFEIRAPSTVIVHGFDTRKHCVYDLDGRPSQMALGALLETMGIAASGYGLRTEVQRILGLADETPTFKVRFQVDSSVHASPLIPAITTRSVQRRPLRTKPLAPAQKAALEACVAPDYEVVWLEAPRDRWRVAMFLFKNAKLRLTMREAYEVHRSVIEWNARFSEDKIPDQAVGADPMTMKLMRWVMQSWARVEFFNTWLGGTLMPRLQLDLLPSWACAAHFALVANEVPSSIDQFVAAGRAMQRFWLEVARLGLFLQPEMTPVIFWRYQRNKIQFSADASAGKLAETIAREFEELITNDRAQRTVFFGRVGAGSPPRARSVRLTLGRLIWNVQGHT